MSSSNAENFGNGFVSVSHGQNYAASAYPGREGGVQPLSGDAEQTFSWRGTLAGIVIGTLICFSSIYYGLQAGQTNSMPLPSALLGYAVFKPFAKYLRTPLSPSENVFVMTVAASMGGIPYTAGLSGTIPALEYLTTAQENGPMRFSLLRLVLWCLSVCLFGIVFASPFRQHFVQRSDLRFPTGTAMAVVISMLHKRPKIMETIKKQQGESQEHPNRHMRPKLKSTISTEDTSSRHSQSQSEHDSFDNDDPRTKRLDNRDLRNDFDFSQLSRTTSTVSFGLSAGLALLTYFVPQMERIPIFGSHMAQNWAWAISLSPAYVGYGMIMHPMTTVHMFLGAIIGWAILSPIARKKGWAPGPAEDWDSGVQGWVVWVALGVILGDSLVGFCWICRGLFRQSSLKRLIMHSSCKYRTQGRPADRTALIPPHSRSLPSQRHEDVEPNDRTPLLRSNHEHIPRIDPNNWDGHKDDTLSSQSLAAWFVGLTIFCVLITWYLFENLLRIWEILASIVMILPLAMASIRSMGETDNALASSLGKIPQFLFALFIPKSNPNAILISLLVGGIAEGGTYQSSDVMEHFKTGHLTAACPKSLFYGQVIGSISGAVLCSCVYKLFTSTYAIPSEKFHVPQAQLWIITADLAYGRGFPPGVWAFVVAGFVLSSIFAVLKIVTKRRKWNEHIPSGIAVGIGIYILPEFTIPQAIGGLTHYICKSHFRTGEVPVITIAIGLVLGESLLNIVTLIFQSLGVGHL